MDLNEGVNPAENGDAPESDQGQQDGLLSQDQEELSFRVAHLEKRVREQEDEIVCLKGALADVVRRLGQVESSKSAQNSILPSRPFKSTSSRRATMGQERPKSQLIESTNFTPRSSGPPTSARPPPRGASATSMGKKWGSTEDTRGHSKTPRPQSGSQLNHSNIKDPIWNAEDKYLRMYLKGRPVTLYAPTSIEDFDVKAPQYPPAQELKLEWVYGYRGRDCRSNIFTMATGEVVYFSAAVAILHNFEEQTQRHYLEHTDDIKCIAVHSDKIKVATGQVAGHEKKEGKTVASPVKKPHVRVWESINLTTLYVVGEGDFQRGVCCVAFSPDDGKLLMAVDESNDHVMSIWDLGKKSKKLVESKTSGDPVTQCDFHPTLENSLVCCGKSQISFWTMEESKTGLKLDKKAGIFQKNEKAKVIICFCFASNGDVVSGDSSGNIYVWEKGSNKISTALPNAHENGVFSLCTMKDGSILSGGGKDRKVILWDTNYEKKEEVVELAEEFGGVRMITQGPGNMILVGTIRNGILQGTLDCKDFSSIVRGHMEELWGLDSNPKLPVFLTCGYDRHIYLWDASSHACVWKKEVMECAHCCCIHPNGEIAVIGTQEGKIAVVDMDNHETVAVYDDGKEQHECVQFSPDGKKLAVGCRDNYIYVYDVEEDGRKYSKIGRCSGHSSYVTHVDWTADGKFIRSNSGDYEVLYWNAETCKQETQKEAVCDAEWATHNCTLAFECVGIWPDGADGTDINNCSAYGKLLASADDFGKVNLYDFPSIQPRATGHSYSGHSSHVTMVRFLCNGTRLISTGGRDMSVMQWEVTDSG